MKILDSKSIYYNQINLIAQPNTLIRSRKEIPNENWRIFVSPMPAIIGETFAKEALNLGLQVVLHRFCPIEEQARLFRNLPSKERVWCAVGLNDNERVFELVKVNCRNFVIDIANGYLKCVVDYLKELSECQEYQLMVGNVHSKEGIWLYKDVPNVYIRTNIGSGSACATSTMAAVNRGQVTEIIECTEAARILDNGINIISDGGISDPSCAVKAFGLGSPFLMMGGYFSKAEEAQNIIDGEYKFWGCASQYNQAKYGEVRRHSEGKVLDINMNEIKPLKTLVADLVGGISSGVSYAGYSTISNFIGNGVFELKH
jgi:IMP dehydrogenase/GMP reductase